MQDQTDISLHRVSAAELVADTLMNLIVSGALQAGQPLRESALAKRLGISRNSLREGIRLLEQSRLVKYEMHRGAIVSEPTLEDLEDLYRTRLHMELAAARVDATDEQLAELRVALERLKEASSEAHEPGPIVSADLDLHQAIVGLLGSERISAFYEQICKELVFHFTVISLADEEYVRPQEPIVARHQEIIDALCERRQEDAVELLRAHIQFNSQRLAEILRARAVPVA